MNKEATKYYMPFDIDRDIDYRFTGDGTVDITGGLFLGSSIKGKVSRLDMRDLGTFEYRSKGEQFVIGGDNETSGEFVLAKNNRIVADAIEIAVTNSVDVNGNTPVHSGKLLLGQNNEINTNKIIMGTGRNEGTLAFNNDNADNFLILRGLTGGESRVEQWIVGSNHSSGEETISQQVDLSKGKLDAKVNDLVISRIILGGKSKADFAMGTGTLDANRITLGLINSNLTAEIEASGTLSIRGGTVLTKELIVGANESTNKVASANGRVDLNDGATLRANSIETGTDANTVGVINWQDGIIGNYAEDEDMTINGTQIKLADIGRHIFQIDGSKAVATVNSILSNATDNGSLNKTGNGTLVLTADNTYTGATTIDNGMLLVNGAIAKSSTTINAGATLAGLGTVGNVRVGDKGVLSNHAGALKIDGDLNFDAGSIYRVEGILPNATNAITVSGNALLSGGTVDLKATAGLFEGNRMTLLIAANPLTDQFSGITSDLAFLTPTLSYGNTEVLLNLERNATTFADVSLTENQRSVANMLQKTTEQASGDTANVINAITSLSAEQARSAYEHIGGAGLIAMQRAGSAFSGNFNNQLRSRLSSIDAASQMLGAGNHAPIVLAANDHVSDLMPALTTPTYSVAGTNPQGATAPHHGLWMRAYGSTEKTDSDGNAASSRNQSGGMSVGFDLPLAEGLVVGAALTHGRSSISAADNESGTSNGNAVALYANYASGPWNLLGYASLAKSNNNMRRHVSFGSIDRTAQADFGSHTTAFYSELSYALPMSGWTLRPLLGLSTSQTATDGFTETGADMLNLQVAGNTVTSFNSLIGAKALIETGKIQWQPRVILAHEHGNTETPMTAQMQGSQHSFTVKGVTMPRNNLTTGLTVSGNASKNVTLFADLNREVNASQSNVGLLLGARVNW